MQEEGTTEGISAAKRERERSTIAFPYGDLDDALAVAKAVYQNAGAQCSVDQLAHWMGHDTVDSGAFRTKLATARIFGAVEVSRNVVTLTAIGRDFNDPRREKQARISAFLHVPLYSKIFEKYRGHLLPPDVGLENEFMRLGVARKQADRARQAFQRSAEQAGFAAQGKDRLVLPAGTVAVASDLAQEDLQQTGVEPIPQAPSAGWHGSGSSGAYHPFIQGLLATLPEPGKEWPATMREQWLNTAKGIFALIYSDTGRGANGGSQES